MTTDLAYAAGDPPKNDKREIFGWLMYDWANSVFFTTVAGVFASEYITGLAQAAVGENGAIISIGGYDIVTAKSLFPYSIGLSVFLQIFFLPIMGVIADYTNLKKAFMAFFCFLGTIACTLFFFVEGNLYVVGAFLFIISNLGAGASIVFYNSFINDIATEDKRDKVSSWGFAAGYVSGSLVLVLNLIFLMYAPSFGISTGMVARICLSTAGIWWGAFALITFALLKKRKPARQAPKGEHLFKAGFRELKASFRDLFHLKHTLHFLVSYLIYNDGIQTVIGVSSVFLSAEVLRRDPNVAEKDVQFYLVIAFLIAQIIGFFGSLAFERIAHYTNAKTGILVSLVIWCAIVIYAYAFLQTAPQALIMSGAIGFVLGGSQALSRSLFSQMIPAGRESAFFGIYEISERGTSWLGPIIFGLVAQLTNSYRPAILALIAFFIVGSIILLTTNPAKAIHAAGQHTPEEAAAEEPGAA